MSIVTLSNNYFFVRNILDGKPNIKILIYLDVAQVVAVKAPGFGERKTSYLEDIAILTGAQVVKDETGLQLDKVRSTSEACNVSQRSVGVRVSCGTSLCLLLAAHGEANVFS